MSLTLPDLDFLKALDEDDNFVFPGFNSEILNIGMVWQFWECHACGNATASKPEKCKKCNSISFEFRRIWAAVRKIA